MGETRAEKFGRFGVYVLRRVVETIPSSERANYLSRFFREFENYSDMHRKKGEPRNAGCVFELDGLDELDLDIPEQFARWFKEGQHLNYQKSTSKKERAGFLGGL